MLHIEKCEFAFRDLVACVACECLSKGFDIPEKCIKFVISTVLINPAYKFTDDRKREKEELNILIDAAVKILCKHNNPSSTTFKLQAYLMNEIGTRDIVLQRHHEQVFSHTENLIRSIVEMTPTTSRDMEKLYRKIVLVIVLLSGLGNPSNNTVYIEAEVALKSIFSLKELKNFIPLNPEEKVMQLKEWTKLVAGIRLFNRNRDKGGEGIENLPLLLEKACYALKEKLEASLAEAKKKSMALSNVLENCYKWDEETPDLMTFKPPLGFTNDQWLFTKELFGLFQQVCGFIRMLITEVNKCEKDLYFLNDLFTSRLFRLTDDVKFRIAVPTNLVYPQFIELSDCWSQLQDIMVVISVCNTVLHNSQKICEEQEIPDYLEEILNGNQSDIEQKEEKEITLIDPAKVKCEVIPYSRLGDNVIQYNFFCPVYTIETDGAVFDANPNLGVLVFEDKFYCFKDLNAAYLFGRDPELYINRVLDYAGGHPEYLDILGVRNEIHKLKVDKLQSLRPSVRRVPLRSKEVQTELHPIASHIDKNYSWNIWDYKRQAINLANLIDKRTHSTQTDKSHFREVVCTQTYGSAEVGCQTMRESPTNFPKPSRYIFGLRGTYQDNAHTIDLTRPYVEGIYRSVPN